MKNQQYKSGFISILGIPNVGKSTLLNRVVGEKIAIVSQKPQTTRTKITGVYTTDAAQMIFIDTPGIHAPRNKLGEYMFKAAEQANSDVDIMLYLVDADSGVSNINEQKDIIKKFASKINFLIINKIDKIQKNAILPIIEKFSELADFAEVIPISAQSGEGVSDLLVLIEKYLPQGPKFFPDDTLTDQPERVIAAEIIREKMFELLEDEIPYGTAVEIEKMECLEERGLTKISAVVHCEKNSHKGMIIGKNGAMLKKIASLARADLERFVGEQVFLEIWVKVSEGWRGNSFKLKNMGYRDS